MTKDTVIKLLIIYLVAITLFTFTDINNEISEVFGLRIYGRYIEGDFIESTVPAMWWPQYGPFIAYSVIGVIIFGVLWSSAKEIPDKNMKREGSSQIKKTLSESGQSVIQRKEEYKQTKMGKYTVFSGLIGAIFTGAVSNVLLNLDGAGIFAFIGFFGIILFLIMVVDWNESDK